ncbi:MAG: serine/threonine protein kinase, partial [Micromonospora sp.]
AGAVAGAAATSDGPAAPTAKVTPPVSTPDAGPTAKLGSPEPALHETRVDAPVPPAVEDTRVDAPPPVKPPNPTSVMPAPISPAPSTGRATVVPGTKPDHRRRNLLIGALVALLLLGLVVAVPLLNGGGDDPKDDGGDQRAGATTTAAAPAEPQAEPSSEPSNSEPAAPAPTTGAPSATPPAGASSGTALPTGWKMYKDETGFSVPLPPGFKLNYRKKWGDGPEDYRVRFSDGKGRAILIDQTTSPRPDPVADWREQEAARRSSYPGYELVKIESVDYWDKAADWEWIYTANGQRIHVRNRGFITAPDKAYAIRWDCPQSDWAENEPVFKIIADGFVPVRK